MLMRVAAQRDGERAMPFTPTPCLRRRHYGDADAAEKMS